MSNRVQITKHFRKVKALFFPLWDRQHRWRINTCSKRTGHGYCDQQRRVIEIMIPPKKPDERDALLIHETCHAVARGSHGKEWQTRMMRADGRAEELGRERLAELLREEVANYVKVQQATKRWEKGAYVTIEDWLNDKPDLTLAQMKYAIAKEYGLLPSEVYKKLPRFKKIFREGKKMNLRAISRRGTPAA